MQTVSRTARHFALALAIAAGGAASGHGAPKETFTVGLSEVDDLKSVYATVRSKDQIEARVRTPGTVTSLKVDEGQSVAPGEVLALVADPKIALKIKAIEAQIVAAQSRLDTAKAELDRSEALKARGVAPQARVDQAQTAFDVASNDLKAARASRAVAETEIAEGEVLAPAAGRVLRVPVTEGSVVMAGESVATIAANEYLLRLELPERHARFMKPGDAVRVGGRGLAADETAPAEGRITQVYPLLSGGRVVADAEAPGLGSYFVGERVLVWISAGKRQTYLVPESYVFRRYGLDYVRIAEADGSTTEVVVQAARRVPGDGEMVEILAGVTAGDRLVQP